MNKYKTKLLALAAFLTVATIGVNQINNARVDKVLENIENNGFVLDKYGTVDYNKQLSRIEDKVFRETDFVFLSMEGDKISKEEISKALANGEDIGLIVRPTDCTYASIYRTIDKVKEIVEDYPITYPILYDISVLMGSDTMRANCLLAEEFCNKLTANGCYVGLYGKEDDMKKFSSRYSSVTETSSFELYDKMISTDCLYKDRTYASEFDGNYTMIQLDNGVVLCYYDLAKLIEDNKLNKASSFVPEFKYVVKDGDCLDTIADDYHIKVADLAEYNSISFDELIQEGQELIIPNNYTDLDISTTNEFEDASLFGSEMSSEALNSLVKGIDVSEYQGDIDWATVLENIDFAILRLCDFSFGTDDNKCTLDNKFLLNMNACELFNIPVGVYYFSRATTPEEAKEEALFVADELKSYSLEYPVYMDVETDELNELMKNNPKQFEVIVDAAMETLESHGYFAGIYCNKSYFDNISYLSNRYSFWLTSNESYSHSVDFEHFNTGDFPVLYMPNDNQSMYQYSSKGSIDGISGDVDINYSVKTLQKVIKLGGFDKPKE